MYKVMKEVLGSNEPFQLIAEVKGHADFKEVVLNDICDKVPTQLPKGSKWHDRTYEFYVSDHGHATSVRYLIVEDNTEPED